MAGSSTRERGRLDARIPCAALVVLALLIAPGVAERAGHPLPTWAKVVGGIVGLLLIGAAMQFGDTGGFATQLSQEELDAFEREYGPGKGTDDPPSG